MNGNRNLLRQNLLKTLGPGILLAGSAIGGSHLIQSTRAGAHYGFKLLVIILLVNVFKYPFFEFSFRYTAATGESILKGYYRIGRWALISFFLVSFITAGINSAAVTLVSAGLTGFIFNTTLSPLTLSIILLSIIVGMLLQGEYSWLDKIMKCMVVVLGICTILAFIAALVKGPQAKPGYTPDVLWSYAGISFLIALMGWMPAPMEVSVWPSLWTMERAKLTKHHPSIKESLCDFHIGYLSTTIMACLFLGLGALVMYGSGDTFSNSGIKFSAQLVNIYTKSLGSWSLLIISGAALLAMFSTTLTAIDAYPRTLKNAIIILFPKLESRGKIIGVLLIFFVSFEVLIIIGLLIDGLKTMIDTATIISFLAAPVIAFINYRAVTSKNIPQEFKPPRWIIVLSWLGILYLSGFSLFYLAKVIII